MSYTEGVLGEDGGVGLDRLARSELVLCLDAELVLLARLEVLHHVVVLAARDRARHFLPQVRPVLALLDHVAYQPSRTTA